jgi:hypothetical protein
MAKLSMTDTDAFTRLVASLDGPTGTRLLRGIDDPRHVLEHVGRTAHGPRHTSHLAPEINGGQRQSTRPQQPTRTNDLPSRPQQPQQPQQPKRTK